MSRVDDEWGDPRDEGVFGEVARRAGRWWVGATVPLVLVAGSFVEGRDAYLFQWAIVSGLYTTPGLVVTALLVRRVDRADRLFWRMWLTALAWAYGMGVTLQVSVLTGVRLDTWSTTGAMAVVILLFGIPLVMMLRDRSGGRTVMLDGVEVAMVLASVLAPVTLLVIEPIAETEEAWWVVPAALAGTWLLTAFSWAIVLFVRLRRGRRVVEGLGIAAALAGAVTAGANVAQGMSGFTLPSGPLLALQALSLGLVLLVPLHVLRVSPEGLDRLPPQRRVRSGQFVAVISLLAMPVLVVETLLLRGAIDWAVPYAFGVVGTLLLLSTLRHLLALGETKRLYAEVARAAAERRTLLADVMRSAEADRHRVAAQLHERAASSYVTFVAFSQATRRDGQLATDDDRAKGIRDDLLRQTEDLRRLMLAIKPLEANAIGPRKLEAPLRAHLYSLYGDATPPDMDVDIRGDLTLDWITETVVLRIGQEALQNVWRHARAKHVTVTIAATADGLTVEVADDGAGFVPERVLVLSGIATMRSFASFLDGTVQVDSSPGAGTIVRARLHASPAGPTPTAAVAADTAPDRPAPDPPGRPALRLIAGGAPGDRTREGSDVER
jgi:signal transduction histidine kinase